METIQGEEITAEDLTKHADICPISLELSQQIVIFYATMPDLLPKKDRSRNAELNSQLELVEQMQQSMQSMLAEQRRLTENFIRSNTDPKVSATIHPTLKTCQLTKPVNCVSCVLISLSVRQPISQCSSQCSSPHSNQHSSQTSSPVPPASSGQQVQAMHSFDASGEPAVTRLVSTMTQMQVHVIAA